MKYDGMTNDQLENLLYSDAQSGDLSESELLYVTGLLEQRGAFDFPDPEKQLERFSEIYYPTDGGSLYDLDEPKPRKIINFRRVVLIAAVVALIAALMTVTAGARGWQIARPSYETAQTIKNDNGVMTADLQREMNKYGVTAFTAPTYIPTDCAQRDLTGCKTDGKICISAEYIRPSGQALLIDITENGEVQTTADVYTHDNTEFYIIETDGGYKAVWQTGSWRGLISGAKSRDELIRIIDSITINP